MNAPIKPLIAAALALCTYAGMGLAADAPDLKSEAAKTGYALGYQIGGDMKRQQVELDSAAVVQGITDAWKGDEPHMSGEAMRATLIELKKRILAQERAAMPEIDKAAEAKLKAHDPQGTPPAPKAEETPKPEPHAKRRSAQGTEQMQEFFTENAKKEGIVTLPSGVQYKVLHEGNGKQPKTGDKVALTYHGFLANGAEFGNTDRGGKSVPQKFPMDSLVPGLRDAVSHMREGDQWQVFVPPHLGFDAKTPLYHKITVFDIQLASVVSE